MKQCTYCGAELQDDARACNNCGRPVPDMPEPEQEKTKPAAEEAVPAVREAEDQAADPAEQEPQSQQPQQGPWGQPSQQDAADWQQDPQNQPQNPWGQQPQQNPWGQPSQQDAADWQQDPQNQPQNPWGQQPQQGPWGQQPPQGLWGWQRNDPNMQGTGQYSGYGNPQSLQTRYNTFAVFSLVFGFLASFLNGLVFIPSIVAIIFGIIGIVQTRKNPAVFKGGWMAFVGLAFGVFFLIIYGYVFHMVFQAVQNPETFQQLQEYLREINAGRS